MSCGFWSPFLKTIVLVACSSGSTNDSNDDSDHNLWGPTIRLKVKECRDTTLNSTEEDPSFINDSASSLMILLLLQKRAGTKRKSKPLSRPQKYTLGWLVIHQFIITFRHSFLKSEMGNWMSELYLIWQSSFYHQLTEVLSGASGI